MCYKKFTSFSKKQRDGFVEFLKKAKKDAVSSTENIAKRDLRSTISTITSPASNSGIFRKACFICDKPSRKHKGERQPLILSTRDLESSIFDMVIKLVGSECFTSHSMIKGWVGHGALKFESHAQALILMFSSELMLPIIRRYFVWTSK